MVKERVVREREADLVNWVELVDPIDSFLIACGETVQTELVHYGQVKSPSLPTSSGSSSRIQRFVSIV
jgi:hypothetical protein